MLFRLDVVVVLETVGSEHLLDFHVGTRGNLVDHGPGEGDLGLVLEIVEEGCGHEPVLHPALRVGEDAGLDAVAVVGAIVHGLHGEREFARLPAFKEQGGDLTQGEHGLESAGEIRFVVAISLLGDGEGDHLERGVAEDVHQALPVLELVVRLEGFGHAGDDFLLDRPV